MVSTEKNLMISSTDKRNYNAIDLLKFLGAILIFTIHIQPFSPESFEYAGYLNILTQKYICRIAVPFYFTASGFFLFKKLDLDNIDFSVITRYCLKILYLFGIWSIILYSTPNGHLWYMKALIVASLIVGFLFKAKLKYRYIAILAIVFYIIGLMGDSYYQIFKEIGTENILGFLIEQYDVLFVKTRNGIFMGVIFVFIGATFSQRRVSIKTIYSVIGFVISMCLLLAEVYIVKHYELEKDTNMYIFLIPTTIFLFDIILKIKLKDRKIYPQLRVVGMIIYYSHMLVHTFVKQFFANIEVFFNVDCSAFLYLTTLLLTIALGVLVEQVSQKDKFKWLQHLYK